MSNATRTDFRKILTLYALVKNMIGKNLKSIIATLLIIGLSSQNLPILLAKTLTIGKHSPAAITTTRKVKKTPQSNSKTKTKTVKSKFQNGTINNKIQISEIFPNPKGKDANNEWIELYNPTDEKTNLGNWRIIQHATKSRSEIQSGTAKTSKPKTLILPDTLTIPPKSYFTLSNQNLKFTLKNQNNLIELKDFNNNTIDAVKYDKSMENLSFAKIAIIKKDKTKIIQKWTKPSKNSKNPPHHEITNPTTNKTTSKNPQNENWLYFSLIPIGLLILLLKKTSRRHGIVNNLGNVGSG